MSLQDALDADPEWRDSFLEGVLDYFTYDGEVYAFRLRLLIVQCFIIKIFSNSMIWKCLRLMKTF